MSLGIAIFVGSVGALGVASAVKSGVVSRSSVSKAWDAVKSRLSGKKAPAPAPAPASTAEKKVVEKEEIITEAAEITGPSVVDFDAQARQGVQAIARNQALGLQASGGGLVGPVVRFTPVVPTKPGVFQPQPKPYNPTTPDSMAPKPTSFGAVGSRQMVTDLGTLVLASKAYASALLALMLGKINGASDLTDPIFKPGGVYCDEAGKEHLLRQMESRITRLAGLQTDGWPANNAGIYQPSGGWGDNQYVVPTWTRAEVRAVYERYFVPVASGLWDCRAMAMEAAVPEFCDAYFRTLRTSQPGPFQALFSGLESLVGGLVSAFTGSIAQGKDLGKELEKAAQAALNNALGQLGKQVDNFFNNYNNWLDTCAKIGTKYSDLRLGLGITQDNQGLDLEFKDKCSQTPAYPINNFMGSASHCRLAGPNQGTYPGVLLFAYIGGSRRYAFTIHNADDIHGGFWTTNPGF